MRLVDDRAQLDFIMTFTPTRCTCNDCTDKGHTVLSNPDWYIKFTALSETEVPKEIWPLKQNGSKPLSTKHFVKRNIDSSSAPANSNTRPKSEEETRADYAAHIQYTMDKRWIDREALDNFK